VRLGWALALGLAVVGCSSSNEESGTPDASPESGDDASDAGSTCLICPTDGGGLDASLGSQVSSRFDTCRGIESGCHGTNAGGLSFPPGNEFANVIRVPSTERPALFRVNPGDPLASYLYLKVLGDGGIDGGQMPLGGPYDPALPPLIFDWIEAGAPGP
jgi:hypothetical protein